jgi:hypothetical protein
MENATLWYWRAKTKGINMGKQTMYHFRLPALFLLAAGSLAALAQAPPKPGDPPGMIVIRPKGSEPAPQAIPGERVLLGTDPDRPGFLVIRPQRGGTSFSSQSPSPRNEGIPHLEIIKTKPTPGVTGSKPSGLPNLPLPEPIPVIQAENPEEGKIIFESYDAAFCRGYKVGYFHVVVREAVLKKKSLVYGVKTMRLSIARFGQAVEMWAEDSTLETPEGEILLTKMRQGLGKDQMLSLTGTVADKKLSVVIENQTTDKTEIPWPEGVLGIAKEATFLRDKKPKSGETLEYTAYEGRLNRVIKYKATAKDTEEAVIAEGRKPQKLVPVIQQMEPIGDFKLPSATIWCDAATYEPLKMETDMPTLGGKLTVIRTTREAAIRPPTKLLDLAEAQSIKLDKTVAGIHDKAGVTYKVTLKSEIPIEKAFPSDDRQTVTVLDAKDRTLELAVIAKRSPKKLDVPPVEPGAEYLADCFYIDWKNDLTKKHAAAAITKLPLNATDWQKAQAVESWVQRNIKATEFSQAMATCANVSKTLSGDCTEYSMLAAGMCRALGIPSRTAIGVVYAPDKDGKPTLAYHMWFEVWTDGQWLALDGTLGRGSIGPGHIKITDASWFEEKSFTPLLPVLSILGASPKVEVVKVVDRK